MTPRCFLNSLSNIYFSAVVLPERPEPIIRILQPPLSTGGISRTKGASGILLLMSSCLVVIPSIRYIFFFLRKITNIIRMSDTYKEFVSSGRALITDTKTAKVKSESVKAPKKGFDTVVESGDPHRMLIKRCIDDKIKKSDVIEEFKKFIQSAEEAL